MKIAKFLRAPNIKNICERPLLKISTSVTNLLKEVIPEFYYPFKRNGFVMQHVLPRFFSVIVFFSQTISAFYNTHQVRCYHFFIVEIIVESVNLIKMLK